MNDQSSKSPDPTFPDLPSFTPSQGLEDGLLPFDLPGGQKIGQSGPEAALVSHSRPRAKEKASKMNGISGPSFFGSSPSAVLQQSLENRLRARLDVNGSLEYKLTWKHWDTESAAPICALRASAHRISDKDFIGWPTVTRNDFKGEQYQVANGKKYLTAVGAAHLAGWATATASKLTQSGDLQNSDGTPWDGTSKPHQNGNPVTTALGDQVKLAGWPTSRAMDGEKGQRTAEGVERERERRQKPPDDLPSLVMLTGWPTTRDSKSEGKDGENRTGSPSLPALVHGVITELFLVPTGRRVVLAPEFSLWLMGFPEAWVTAAPGAKDWREAQAALELECSRDLETPSSPSLPPNS